MKIFLLQLSLLLLTTVGTFAFEECNVARPCKFNYSNDSGVICSMMTGNAVLQINDTTKANQIKSVCLPCNATVDGFCNHQTNNSHVLMNELSLSWEESNGDLYELIFTFTKGKQWTLSNITVLYTDEADKLSEVEANAATDFIGDLDFYRSYLCNHNHSVALNPNQSNITISVSFSDFQIQSFKFNEEEQFGKIARCTWDVRPSKIVPIAIGAALGGLLLIIFIVYSLELLRRRRAVKTYQRLSQ